MNRTSSFLLLIIVLLLIGCAGSASPPIPSSSMPAPMPSLPPMTATSVEFFTLPTVTSMPIGATSTSQQEGELPAPVPSLPAPTLEATVARPGESGIAGVVTLGPMCPVQQQDDPCPDQPYSAVITILDANGIVVRQITSDTAGQFAVQLAPGTYTLHPEPPEGNILPHAADQAVTVEPGTYTQVMIAYDTGIR